MHPLDLYLIIPQTPFSWQDLMKFVLYSPISMHKVIEASSHGPDHRLLYSATVIESSTSVF